MIMNTKKFLQLIGFIVLAQTAGIIGSVFTSPNIPTWYATLVKPALNPPSWVFGPVWTTLFVLMGIAAFLVFSACKKELPMSEKIKIRIAMGLFVFQLVLNTLWSILFFGMQNPAGAFVEIILLWLAIAATIIAFYRVSKPAAYLLLPYIAWVSFAAYLNYSIWMLN